MSGVRLQIPDHPRSQALLITRDPRSRPGSRHGSSPFLGHAADCSDYAVISAVVLEDFYTVITGLLQQTRDRLRLVNGQDQLMIATRMGNVAVKKGDKLAGMRVIPLVIEAEKLDKAAELVGPQPLLRVVPFTVKTCAVIVTGSEVAKGLIEDKFGPVVEKKLEDFSVETIYRTKCVDDTDTILKAIAEARAAGADLILCTGGMSVDPDDKTPGAIMQSGARIVTYGGAALPGAMLCLGYFEDGVPILGLPGCVMYHKATIFDIVLPRVLAGVEISKADIAELGYGGFCLGCKECRFPDCSFGKGW